MKLKSIFLKKMVSFNFVDFSQIIVDVSFTMTSQTDTDCATSQYVYLINRYVYVMLGSSWSEYLHILRIIVSNECVPLTHEIFMNTHSKFII